MPVLRRPDGAELHWEAHGSGPPVAICNTFNLAPVDGLLERLAAHRHVIAYDPRGVGRSARGGPYDLVTGVLDLEALLAETGPAGAALGIGDGAHRAIRLAVARPDLVDRVVLTSTSLDPSGGEGFAGSIGVLDALMSLIERDYRAGLHSMVAGSAPDDIARERVEVLAEYVPQEAAVGYLRAWIGAASFEHAQLLGERLTILGYPGNDWFPMAVFEGLRDSLPKADFVRTEDGPMNRPDQTAEVLLSLSEPARSRATA